MKKNVNILTRFLDRQLKYCDTYDKPLTAYDQVFGGVQMFLELYPDNATQDKVAALWNDVYRPQFEHKVYGV